MDPTEQASEAASSELQQALAQRGRPPMLQASSYSGPQRPWCAESRFRIAHVGTRASGRAPTAELAAKECSAIPRPLQPLEQSIRDVESDAACVGQVGQDEESISIFFFLLLLDDAGRELAIDLYKSLRSDRTKKDERFKPKVCKSSHMVRAWIYPFRHMPIAYDIEYRIDNRISIPTYPTRYQSPKHAVAN